ncbi:hypothetical protein BH18ACI1_BH18ACI1_01660 [soil metagenome]
MEQKQCLVCNAMVDETKAFCPECGNPLETEQQRQESNEISGMSQTFRLDDDSFKQMLKDMNLSPEAAKVVERQTRTNLNINLSEILEEQSPKPPVQPIVLEKPVQPIVPEKKDSKISVKTLLIIISVLLSFLIFILAVGIIFYIWLKR